MPPSGFGPPGGSVVPGSLHALRVAIENNKLMKIFGELYFMLIVTIISESAEFIYRKER